MISGRLGGRMITLTTFLTGIMRSFRLATVAAFDGLGLVKFNRSPPSAFAEGANFVFGKGAHK